MQSLQLCTKPLTEKQSSLYHNKYMSGGRSCILIHNAVYDVCVKSSNWSRWLKLYMWHINQYDFCVKSTKLSHKLLSYGNIWCHLLSILLSLIINVILIFVCHKASCSYHENTVSTLVDNTCCAVSLWNITDEIYDITVILAIIHSPNCRLLEQLFQQMHYV